MRQKKRLSSGAASFSSAVAASFFFFFFLSCPVVVSLFTSSLCRLQFFCRCFRFPRQRLRLRRRLVTVVLFLSADFVAVLLSPLCLQFSRLHDSVTVWVVIKVETRNGKWGNGCTAGTLYRRSTADLTAEMIESSIRKCRVDRVN